VFTASGIAFTGHFSRVPYRARIGLTKP
jgi:hypothetical protein